MHPGAAPCRPFRRSRPTAGRPLALAVTAATIVVAAMIAGCATPPPAADPEPAHWTISRTVASDSGMVTLFDPAALAHHRVDPPDWYRHDFAFSADLAAGRFAAVLTGREGSLDVRLTDAPLSEREAAAAGPRAIQRLRVTDRRLLLAGGDAWPSVERPRDADPFDERWLSVEDGDYEVTITVIDDVDDDSLHDVVFRLRPVESMTSVAHAPGIPRLVVGAPPALVGAAARGRRFVERCAEVPRDALWTLPVDVVPLPGEWGAFEVDARLHDRGLRLQEAGLEADLPLVLVERPVIGALGPFVRPQRWREPERVDGRRDVHAVQGRASCLVRVTDVDDEGGLARLTIEPVPGAADRLPRALREALIERFATFVRVTGDPAWRYKGAWIRRAPDDGSLVLGIMRQLRVRGAERDALLLESNETRARRLLERMADTGA